MNDRETAGLQDELLNVKAAHLALQETVTHLQNTVLEHIEEGVRMAQARIKDMQAHKEKLNDKG